MIFRNKLGCKPFQDRTVFAGMTGAYPSETPFRCSTGRLLALPINNRLRWKSLAGANTLAYYENSQLTTVKSFITLALGLVEKIFIIFGGSENSSILLI
jgi:hypothetical protein